MSVKPLPFTLQRPATKRGEKRNGPGGTPGPLRYDVHEGVSENPVAAVSDERNTA